MGWKGPISLFISWVIHDVEEAVAFPATCSQLADRTGVEQLRMTPRQSWLAVTLMGALVAVACVRGARTGGRSRMYRAVTAGLEAHVISHIAATVFLRSYTAGVATALPVMLPGALIARKELERSGHSLQNRDTILGAGLLVPAALVCHVVARLIRRT